MKRLIFTASILIIMLCSLLPSIAYAWDDPWIKPVCLRGCGLTGYRWPVSVSGVNHSPTIMDAPPQLDAGQAYRWSVASPLSRMRLAMLYEVPTDVAVEYGAIDIDALIKKDMYRYSIKGY